MRRLDLVRKCELKWKMTMIVGEGDDMELAWNILNIEMSKIYLQNVNLRSKSHKIDCF